MITPHGGKTCACGSWSCSGTRTTRAIGCHRREWQTPRRSAGPGCISRTRRSFHGRGTRDPHAGNLAAGRGQGDLTITSATGLRSAVEDRWRQAAKAEGTGADLDAIGAVDPNLIDSESLLLGSALRQIVDGLAEGGRALVVGHSRPMRRPSLMGCLLTMIRPLACTRRWARIEPTGNGGAGSGVAAARTPGVTKGVREIGLVTVELWPGISVLQASLAR
jgi:hypothetical protein